MTYPLAEYFACFRKKTQFDLVFLKTKHFLQENVSIFERNKTNKTDTAGKVKNAKDARKQKEFAGSGELFLRRVNSLTA